MENVGGEAAFRAPQAIFIERSNVLQPNALVCSVCLPSHCESQHNQNQMKNLPVLLFQSSNRLEEKRRNIRSLRTRIEVKLHRSLVKSKWNGGNLPGKPKKRTIKQLKEPEIYFLNYSKIRRLREDRPVGLSLTRSEEEHFKMKSTCWGCSLETGSS